jgi:hypothetical protein
MIRPTLRVGVSLELKDLVDLVGIELEAVRRRERSGSLLPKS